jgi:hypothetical protein
MMRALPTSLVVVACLALPSLAHAGALRCDNKIVSEGASQLEALKKCGEPANKQSRVVYATNKSKAKSRTAEESVEVTSTITIEEWTYNFGPNRLLQTAVFQNGRLVEVQSGTYGY